jgi:hypothetical protein
MRWWATSVAAVGLIGFLLTGSPAVADSGAVHSGATATALTAPAGPEGSDDSASPRASAAGRPAPPAHTGSLSCLGLVPPPYAYPQHSPYLCADWRLGPTRLPTTGVLGGILSGYNRLGGLTPVEFLNKWWNPALDAGRGDWRYPPDRGFARDSQGNLIVSQVVLHPGQKIDRFGDEAGTFLAPAGTKYGQRSIPPSNLDTTDPRYPFNYHVYRVLKDFKVDAGPAAPAFEQPGEGIQYVLTNADFPDDFVNVRFLVLNGYLARLN